MRLPNTHSYRGMPISMTPMIDVVFLLVLFFTATSTIAKTEFGQIELPAAERGKDRDGASRKRRVTANVLADGSLVVSGRTVDSAGFRDILHAELTERPADQIEVEVRADRSAQYRSVEPLLVVCAQAGIARVSFTVMRPVEK